MDSGGRASQQWPRLSHPLPTTHLWFILISTMICIVTKKAVPASITSLTVSWLASLEMCQWKIRKRVTGWEIVQAE